MKIKRIQLQDFGVFDGQVIEDIKSNFVVIGGYNRAGKTTFMKALRHMGYGFSKGKEAIHKRKRYHVVYDVEVNGEEYRTEVIGNAQPKTFALNGTELTTKTSLYGIDRFRYQQLFTIDLDQLKPVPDTVASREKEQLQSILLGGGLKELAVLPAVAKQFGDEAGKIGATKGNPTTKQFAQYAAVITDKEKQLEMAKNELFEFTKLKQQAIENTDEQAILDEKIEKISQTGQFLSFLEQNYHLYQERQLILEQLEQGIEASAAKQYDIEDLPIIKQEFQNYQRNSELYYEQFLAFSQSIAKPNALEYANAVIKKNNEIDQAYRNVITLQPIEAEQERKAKEVAEKQVQLGNALQQLGTRWQGVTSEELSNLPLDEQSGLGLKECLKKQQIYNNEAVHINEELIRAQRQAKELKSQKENLKPARTNKYVFAVVSSLAVVLTGVLFFINLPAAIVNAFACVGVLGIITFREKTTANGLGIIEQQLLNVVQELDVAQSKMSQLQEKKEKCERQVDTYRDWLRLDIDASDEILELTFQRLQTITASYQTLKRLEDEAGEINQNANEFREAIIKAVDGLADLSKTASVNELNDVVKQLINHKQEVSRLMVEKNRLDKQRELLAKMTLSKDDELLERNVIRWIEQAELARERYNFETQLRQIEHQIAKLFHVEETKLIWQRAVGQPQAGFVEQFISVCDIQNLEAIQQEKVEKQQEYRIIKNQKDELMKQAGEIKEKIKILETDTRMQEAMQSIDNARASLSQLAYKYAVLRMAEYMARTVEKEMVEDVQQTLLKESTELFKTMTGGEFTKIQPASAESSVEFTIANDNTQLENSNQMSRGTVEQLYLAVRISRIQEIDAKLPVIIDDSFVNFDALHLRQTIGILNELSKTNQIFVMTCHKQLVDEIHAINTSAQYYQLDKGVFTSTNAEDLATYLSKQNTPKVLN